MKDILLEQDGAESGVEGANTLLLQDLGETTDQAVGESGLRHQSDTGSLERAEGDVGDELGARGRSEVDSSAVVDSVLVADQVDAALLEELVSTELEGTLEEVTGKGGTETSQESAGTLLGDDLTETANEALVVGGRVELDPRLDATDG